MILKKLSLNWQRLLITSGIVLLAALVVGGTTWYVMDKGARVTKEANEKEVIELQKRIDKLQGIESNKNVDNKNLTKTGDEILSIDSNFNKYINYDLGFQIDIPKQAYYSNASCAYSTTDGDHSYRPIEGMIPTKVIVDNESVYITQEYFYRLTGVATDSNGKSFFSGCEKTNTNLAILTDTETWEASKWKIDTKTASDDATVEAIIKQTYGSGCSLGTKTATTNTGTESIAIQGDGLDLGTTKCPVNFGTAMFYNQSKGKFSFWNTGQAYSFYTQEFADGYDTGMKNSFKFL